MSVAMTAILTGLGLAAAAGFNAWAVLILFHGLYLFLPQEFPGPVSEARRYSRSRSSSFSPSS